MHEYRCKILRVVDGDTVDVDIDLGFGIWIHKERVRVMGIDTPESRTRDLVEKAFGVNLGTLVNDFGGGTWSGKELKAIQVGGPLGAYLSRDDLELLLDYEAFSEVGAVLGHGGIVIFDETANMKDQAKFAFDFCVWERG